MPPNKYVVLGRPEIHISTVRGSKQVPSPARGTGRLRRANVFVPPEALGRNRGGRTEEIGIVSRRHGQLKRKKRLKESSPKLTAEPSWTRPLGNVVDLTNIQMIDTARTRTSWAGPTNTAWRSCRAGEGRGVHSAWCGHWWKSSALRGRSTTPAAAQGACSCSRRTS